MMGTGDYLRIRDNFLVKGITHFGYAVTRTPITKTVNSTYGDEVLTEGTSESIIVYIVRKGTKWFSDNAGDFQQADALMLTLHTQTVNRNDKIVYLNSTYRIEEVLERTAGEGQVVYKVCPLYLIE